MRIQVTATTQVLLQLISAYQGIDGPPVTAGTLWGSIRSFMKESKEPVFRAYEMNNGLNSEKPVPQFLGDVAELIRYGQVTLVDGKFSLTPTGRVITFAREVHPKFKPLEEKVRDAGVKRL